MACRATPVSRRPLAHPQPAPARRVYVAIHTPREPRPNTPMTCQKRGSFDSYTYRPCMEAAATFSGEKTASTALKTIGSRRGGYLAGATDKGGSGQYACCALPRSCLTAAASTARARGSQRYFRFYFTHSGSHRVRRQSSLHVRSAAVVVSLFLRIARFSRASTRGLSGTATSLGTASFNRPLDACLLPESRRHERPRPRFNLSTPTPPLRTFTTLHCHVRPHAAAPSSTTYASCLQPIPRLSHPPLHRTIAAAQTTTGCSVILRSILATNGMLTPFHTGASESHVHAGRGCPLAPKVAAKFRGQVLQTSIFPTSCFFRQAGRAAPVSDQTKNWDFAAQS
ncbi:hypothetical protein CC86DRAFT_451352 [Ophiobolus disseminans]|uniref:Uncharacterized protein n=1 Tax=Ophiobolus disseminans TaxID=1469910 RepID=A0A6A7AM78_9PLEO|nr:hypothetical protein CC86DRAFT_451352 [Ophiobolus disseminans]